MKKFKRILSLFFAVFMAVMTVGATTAFAAETNVKADYMDNSVSPAATTTIVNQTFNISGSHTGSVRTYNCNGIGFTCTFKDQNGNPLTDGSILAVRLYTRSGQLVKEWQGSNGMIVVASPSINLTYGGRYYFQYIVAYGTPNMRINMNIYTS